jgi:membrane protein
VSALVADLRAVVPRFREDQGFLLAAALSFTALLCAAPLALILLSLAGYLMQSDEIAVYVFDATTLMLPAYGQELAEFLALLTKDRAVTGVLGIASWAVFATQFFSLLRTVLNRTFRVARRRGIVHGFALDLFAVVVVGSVAITFTVAVVILVALADVVGGLMPLHAWPPGLPRRLLSLPLIYTTGLGLVLFVYRALPNTRVPASAALTATLAFAGAWEVARWVFTAYVRISGTYGHLYGSFGVGIAALIWIYYSAVIFVLGAELAALGAERGGGSRASNVT